MAITIVEDGDKYISEMDEYDVNVVQFYRYGKDSLLIDTNDKEGGNETLYLHTLRFYVPVLARRVWKDLKVGLGVFNTQGVEACNKQSEKAWNHCTNGWKGKQTEQVMWTSTTSLSPQLAVFCMYLCIKYVRYMHLFCLVIRI